MQQNNLLSGRMTETLTKMGYNKFTEIQEKCIPTVMTGADILAQAETGSGKTAAFGIPIIEKIDTTQRNPQALILCPTRELAKQTAGVLKKLGAHIKNLHVTDIYGGQSVNIQIKALRSGCHIIVGTPGRTLDLIGRKFIKLKNVKTVVLDEADEMLDMGFRDELNKILAVCPDTRQSLLFSATMSADVVKTAEAFLKPSHKSVTIDKCLKPVSTVSQFYTTSKEKGKLTKLENFIETCSPKLTLVFCNTKRKVDDVSSRLASIGIPCGAIHGDIKQNSRETIMKQFKNGNIRVLIATDVAARGIDIKDIDMVVNYDFPSSPESYIHRIGRTGRAGRRGTAFTLIGPKETDKIYNVQKLLNTKIKLVENV